jgi:hypothetical protein
VVWWESPAVAAAVAVCIKDILFQGSNAIVLHQLSVAVMHVRVLSVVIARDRPANGPSKIAFQIMIDVL